MVTAKMTVIYFNAEKYKEGNNNFNLKLSLVSMYDLVLAIYILETLF